MCVDDDADGFDTCEPDNQFDTDGNPADCNDTNAEINPGNVEICDLEGTGWGDPGRRDIPLTCGETMQFTVCTGCLEDPCYEWSLNPPSIIGSTIDPDTGLFTAGTDCGYLAYPIEETIVVTDPCNGGISDTLTLTVGQVVLGVLNTEVQYGDQVVQVTVTMANPDHKIKALQIDLGDEGNELTCTGCAADPDRAPQFNCSTNELGDGSCRVVITTTNPAALILEGGGPVCTVDYTIGEGALAEECVDLTFVNSLVSDRFGEPLCACPVEGQICLIACGDLYPRECLPGNPVCGDGRVDIFDKLEVIDYVLGLTDLSECQRTRADVPTGTLPYCAPPDGEIDELDILVISDMAEGKANCCDYYYFGKIY
jgi:hypothetical protein